MPFDNDGKPLYEITAKTWACFFRHFATHLDLIPEEDQDGNTTDTDRAFRCTARSSNESV